MKEYEGVPDGDNDNDIEALSELDEEEQIRCSITQLLKKKTSKSRISLDPIRDSRNIPILTEFICQHSAMIKSLSLQGRISSVAESEIEEDDDDEYAPDVNSWIVGAFTRIWRRYFRREKVVEGNAILAELLSSLESHNLILEQLQELSIVGYGLGKQHTSDSRPIVALLQSCPRLQILNLEYNQFQNADIAEGFMPMRIFVLKLSYNEIGFHGAKTIIENVKFAKEIGLACITKVSNEVIQAADDAFQFCEALGSAFRGPLRATLEVLDLHGNYMGSSFACAAEAFTLDDKGEVLQLKILNLEDNLLDAKVAVSLADALEFTLIEYLNLDDNCIKDEGASALFKILRLTRIRELKIGNNDIHDQGGLSLIADFLLPGTKEIRECRTINPYLENEEKKMTINLKGRQSGSFMSSFYSSSLQRDADHFSDEVLGGFIDLVSRQHPRNISVHIIFESSRTDPFLHSDITSMWATNVNRPFYSHFFLSLAGCKGADNAFYRWMTVLGCVVAVCLPAVFENGSSVITEHTTSADLLQNVTVPIIAKDLGRVCGEFPSQFRNAYFDPLSLLITASGIAFLYWVTVKVIYLISAIGRLCGFLCSSCHRCCSRCCCKCCCTFDDNIQQAGDEAKKRLQSKAAEKAGAVATSGSNAHINSSVETTLLESAPNDSFARDVRAFFLATQLFVIMFLLGDYFFWSPTLTGVQHKTVLCRVARFTDIIVYKPFFVALMYLLMYCWDVNGERIFHNGITDSLLAIVFLLLDAWQAVAFIFSGPVLILYFYFTFLFFIIPLAFVVLVGRRKLFTVEHSTDERKGMKKPNGEFETGWNGTKVMEALGHQYLFKRLLFCSKFAVLVYAVTFWTFYLGEDYESIAHRSASAFIPPFPNLPSDFFMALATILIALGDAFLNALNVNISWPNIPVVGQVAMVVSATMWAGENALMTFTKGMSLAFPRRWDINPKYTINTERAQYQSETEGSKTDSLNPMSNAMPSLSLPAPSIPLEAKGSK